MVGFHADSLGLREADEAAGQPAPSVSPRSCWRPTFLLNLRGPVTRRPRQPAAGLVPCRSHHPGLSAALLAYQLESRLFGNAAKSTKCREPTPEQPIRENQSMNPTDIPAYMTQVGVAARAASTAVGASGDHAKHAAKTLLRDAPLPAALPAGNWF